MNDIYEKNGVSCAIVEKKPQKPEGCAGIFIKLFDWNRRLANKKLFSMKLLPPVDVKEASTKFVGNEKQQPKLRLIADENRGGFPKKCNDSATVYVEQKREMGVPGVVARLMGLESMPSSQTDNPKKLPSSEYIRTESSPERQFVYLRNDLNVEQGRFRLELRPQKLQKSNMPLRNVISKSRKLHPQLPSPVKSPRNCSRKSSSKLIGAASKILEPGLQRSKLKCPITYSNNLYRSSNDPLMDERPSLSPSKSFYSTEQSCRNCGYFEDTSNIYEQPFIFASPLLHYVGSPCHDHQRGELRQSSLYRNIEENRPFGGQTQQFKSADSKRNLNKTSSSARASLNSPVSSKRRSTTPFMNWNGSSFPVNERLSVIAAPPVSDRVDNDKFGLEKRIVRRLNASLPPGQKWRSTNNICREGETSDISFSGVTSGRNIERNYQVIYCQCYRDRSFQLHEGTFGYSDDSLVKLDTAVDEVKESGETNGLHVIDSTKNSISEESCFKKRIMKQIPINGDKLGAVLEEKLKDLNSQVEESGGNAPKKSTAMILEELIYALTSEVPIQDENLSALPCSISSTSTQANGITTKLSVDSLSHDEYSRPGSCLVPYFSAESCVIGSMGIEEYADSAASKANSSKELVMKIFRNVSETLRHNALTTLGMNGNKHEQAETILLNAELFLHSAALSSSIVGTGSLIKHLLIDNLGSLANALWMKLGSTLGVKETNGLKRFALDSSLEFLNSRFERDPITCSKKLPIRISTDVLVFEIVDRVAEWSESSQFSYDELIEREMRFNLKEWTEYEREIYEYGLDFSTDLLQTLVDEAMFDL